MTGAATAAASSEAPPVLRVTGAGKCYRLYSRFHHRIVESVTLGRVQRHYEFWSLRDIGFEIKRGEAFGIIGVNGAGKSSLLRLLSGVQQPTTGDISVAGRITSLLNLSAGFNGDFTGRDNIDFNCAIRGLTREQTAALAPGIIAFSELGEFVDQPLRTYSTGMTMRLGFSIATAVAADIMIFDEVLAVGDDYFMQKCLQRIREYLEQGKTLILATHNMHQLRSLCDRALWLSRGEIKAIGPVNTVANGYIEYLREKGGKYEDPNEGIEHPELDRRLVHEPGAANLSPPPPAAPSPLTPLPAEAGQPDAGADEAARSPPGTSAPPLHASLFMQVHAVEILDAHGVARGEFEHGDKIEFRVSGRARDPLDNPIFGIALHRSDGVYVWGPNTAFDAVATGAVAGEFSFSLILPECWLLPGKYEIRIGVYDKHHLLPLLRIDEAYYGFRVVTARQDHGLVRMPHEWIVTAPRESS